MELEVSKLCRICLSESDELEPLFGSKFQNVAIVEILMKVCYGLRCKIFESLFSNFAILKEMFL